MLVAQHGWLRMELIERERQWKRRGAWRRHALGLMGCFALVASGLLWAAPMVQRTYVVEGRIPVDIHAAEGVDTTRVPEMVAKEVAVQAAKEGVRVTVASGGEDRTIRVEGTGESREAALQRVQEVGDRLALLVRERGEAMSAAFRTGLGKDGDRLAAEGGGGEAGGGGVSGGASRGLAGRSEQCDQAVGTGQRAGGGQAAAVGDCDGAQIGRLEAYEKIEALAPHRRCRRRLPMPGASRRRRKVIRKSRR